MLRACQATTAARAARQQTTVNSIPLPSSRSDFVNSYCGCGLNRRIQGNEVWALGRRAQSPELRRGANAPPLGACDHAVKRRATPVKRRVTPVKCALSLHSCGPSGTTRPCTSSTCTRPSSTLRAWCLGKCDHAAKRRIAPVKCIALYSTMAAMGGNSSRWNENCKVAWCAMGPSPGFLWSDNQGQSWHNSGHFPQGYTLSPKQGGGPGDGVSTGKCDQTLL